MFERILLRLSHGSKGGIDPGAIAEALLFYKEVRWVTGVEGLRAFTSFAGADVLVELIRGKLIHIELYPEMFAAQNYNNGTNSFITCTIYRLPHAPKNTQDYIELAFLNAGVTKSRAKRLSASIAPSITFHNFNEDFKRGYSFLAFANETVAVPSYTTRAVRELVRTIAPEYPGIDSIEYEINFIERDTFRIKTNLEFTRLNALSMRDYDPTHEWTKEGISTKFLSSLFDIHVSGKFSSAIITSDAKAAFIKSRYMLLAEKTTRSLDETALFQRTVLPDVKTIRDVVNSGEKTIVDVIRLLEQAEKFKDWISSLSEDANLIQEYIKSITKVSWLDKMPTKTFRLLIANVVGLSNPLTAAVHSAADIFLVDHIVKGWRPTLFIEGALRDFLDV